MKGKLLNRVALSCCFIFFVSIGGDLNGKWQGVLTAPDGNEYPLIYDFKADGDSLTVTTKSASGLMVMSKGKISNDSFYFDIDVDGVFIKNTGRIYEDSCGLDIDYEGYQFHSTLRRVVVQ